MKRLFLSICLGTLVLGIIPARAAHAFDTSISLRWMAPICTGIALTPSTFKPFRIEFIPIYLRARISIVF